MDLWKKNIKKGVGHYKFELIIAVTKCPIPQIFFFHVSISEFFSSSPNKKANFDKHLLHKQM
jgi:hypothetical protein